MKKEVNRPLVELISRQCRCALFETRFDYVLYDQGPSATPRSFPLTAVGRARAIAAFDIVSAQIVSAI